MDKVGIEWMRERERWKRPMPSTSDHTEVAYPVDFSPNGIALCSFPQNFKDVTVVRYVFFTKDNLQTYGNILLCTEKLVIVRWSYVILQFDSQNIRD